MGISPEIAQGSIRISLGRENTEEDVDYTVNVLENVISKLRNISSQWQIAGKKAM
jgi:cysteine desulfurase